MNVYKYGRTVSSFVVNYRRDKDLTQVQLGDMLGFSGQYICNVEKDVYTNPVQFCATLIPYLTQERARCLAELISDSTWNMMVKKLKVKKKTRLRRKKAR